MKRGGIVTVFRTAPRTFSFSIFVRLAFFRAQYAQDCLAVVVQILENPLGIVVGLLNVVHWDLVPFVV